MSFPRGTPTETGVALSTHELFVVLMHAIDMPSEILLRFERFIAFVTLKRAEIEMTPDMIFE